MPRRLATILFAVALAYACGDDDSTPPPAPPDAGPLCTNDPAETCTACYQQIGTCCYDDPTIMGNVPALVTSCEAEPSCVRCCDECAAMDCDTLRAGNNCPNDIPGT